MGGKRVAQITMPYFCVWTMVGKTSAGFDGCRRDICWGKQFSDQHMHQKYLLRGFGILHREFMQQFCLGRLSSGWDDLWVVCGITQVRKRVANMVDGVLRSRSQYLVFRVSGKSWQRFSGVAGKLPGIFWNRLREKLQGIIWHQWEQKNFEIR